MNKRNLIIGGIAAVLIIGAIGSAGVAPQDVPQPSPIASQAPATPVAPTATPEPTPEPTPALTASQQNAIESAEDYLAFSSFSRKGLINQLVFEGFSKADATFAVDSLDVDWNEQAYGSAKAYLDYSSFSRKSLIAQLVFEGFSKEQAAYGATKAGL